MSSNALPGATGPSSGIPPGGLPVRSAIGILAGLMIGILLGALDNTIVATALSSIVSSFNDAGELPFVISAYLITQTISMPIFGKLSDQYSRRTFYVLGIVIFLGGSILSGLAQNLDELLVFRAVQGVGSGAFFPVANSIIAVLFSPQTRARLTGLFSSVFGIATIVGPLVGSYIVDHTTWRWIFYINLPLGAVALGLVMTRLGPMRAAVARRGFDWVGASLLSAWIGTLMFALIATSPPTSWAWTDARVLGLLAVTVAGFAAFAVWENRHPEPLLPLRVFRQQVVAAGSAVGFLRGAVMIGVVAYIPLMVGITLGLSPDVQRDVLYGLLVPMIVGAGVGGQLLRRVGYRPLVVGGMLIMTFGALLLTQVSATMTVVGFAFGFLPVGLVDLMIPVGFGIGVTFAATMLAVQYGVPPKDIGVGSSLVTFAQNLGGAVGVSALYSFQAWRLGTLLPTGPPGPSTGAAVLAAVFQSYRDVFAVLVAISVVAVIAATFLVGRLPTAGAPGANPASGPAAREATAAAPVESAPLSP